MKNKMKHTFQDILDFCENNKIELNKMVSYNRIYGSSRNKYVEHYNMFENEFGTIVQEICDRTSDGDHDQSLLVVSIGEGKDKIYFGGYGTYTSYEGDDFDYMTVKEMQPYQKVVTDWKVV